MGPEEGLLRSLTKIVFVIPSDRSHCLLMFDAVNKTSNDMEFSSSVQNGNQSNCGKNFKN